MTPKIAEDIEMIVTFAAGKLAFREWTEHDRAVAEALSRVEEYLATYSPEEKINE